MQGKSKIHSDAFKTSSRIKVKYSCGSIEAKVEK